jgi:hypothetical protein
MLFKRLVVIAVLALSAVAAAQPLIFPGAEGFGVRGKAGRGGKIIKVTNLNESGSGSLADAVGQSGPRIVVFEVGGVIKLNKHIEFRNPYITIAGQTAPDPGVTIIGGGFYIRTAEILIQHISLRPCGIETGLRATNRDGLQIHARFADIEIRNVVIDHCSITWGVDENASVAGWLEDGPMKSPVGISFTDCIIAEGLDHSLHPEGGHSKGLLIAEYVDSVSVIRCLFSDNKDRNPMTKGRSHTVLLNSYIYNPGIMATHAHNLSWSEGSRSSWFTAIGNSYKAGSSTGLAMGGFLRIDYGSGSRLFTADNIAEGGSWKTEEIHADAAALRNAKEESLWFPTPVRTMPSSAVRDLVLAHAGARPAKRDPIDARIVDEVGKGTGGIIDNENEVGGAPKYSQTTRALQLPSNPNADDDGDGYTNMDEWLRAMADEVEGPEPDMPTVGMRSRLRAPSCASVAVHVREYYDIRGRRLNGNCHPGQPAMLNMVRQQAGAAGRLFIKSPAGRPSL